MRQRTNEGKGRPIKRVWYVMKRRDEENRKKLLRTLEKQYAASELFSLLLSYAERSLSCAKGGIRYPRLYDAIGRTMSASENGDPLTIARGVRDAVGDLSYAELSMFYEYATLKALSALSREVPSDHALCDTLEFLKALHGTEPEELYPLLSEAEGVLLHSPYFEGCDEATKQTCRRRVAAYAEKHGISEREAAEILAVSDPFRYRKGAAARLYFPILTVLFLLFSLLALVIVRHLPVVLFLLLPLSEAAKQITDLLFSYAVKAAPLPRKKLSSLPKEAPTLTVITALLNGSDSDLALVERLRNCYFANCDENAYFGLLCDLGEAGAATAAADEEIIGRIKKSIEALNAAYGCRLYLFVRSRRYAPTEKKYMGWERKRGALIELTRFLRGKDTTLTVYGADPSPLTAVRYVITLDVDTRLYTGAVRDLVGVMLHPSNTPVIENGVVVRGHAILQPRMEASLASAEKTPFAVLSAGNGGTDIYATAAYETYQSLFDEGIFCGKGIFDVDVFASLIDGAFLDGTVLSHDLLEGSRLRAGAVTDLSLTDDLPKNPLSCLDRSHRWIRGDVQSLLFSGKYVSDSEGRLYRNPISSLSRHKIRDNVRRALTPVSAVAALLLSLLAPKSISLPAAFFAILYLLLPFFFSFVSLRRGIGRRFFSYLLPRIATAAGNLLYGLGALLQTAYMSADAVLRAGYRVLFSRQKMLEWKTASDSERGIKGLSLYLYRMLPSLLVGLSLLLFCPRPFFRFLGLLWVVFPFAAYRIGKPFAPAPSLSEEEKKTVLSYAKDTWQFFERNVTAADHDLPPDNIQLSPTEAVAHRTSPTNIGLYLLSCLAAKEMGFLSLSDLIARLKKTLTTLSRLQRWHGHFYNWYDTTTLSILGTPYVSTVDSGNLITCLVALRQGLIAADDGTRRLEEIEKSIAALIDETDFRVLYHEKKKLFFIGKNTALPDDENGGCYDLLMSEARTTSFYAIAAGQIPREHWRRLGRGLICGDGYLGLSSWTGTMFEYLMPALLLPTRFGSLSYEAVSFAIREQKAATVAGLWGRSESGYYLFDAEMNYQYRAFGAPSLALKRGMEKDRVIAPYAAMLCLPFRAEEALDNLERMKHYGMYGPYGFFEAVDFTPSRVGRGHAVIRSYMSHHMGMSLLACANAACNNVMIRHFLSDPRMASAMDLLEEKVPVDAGIARRRVRPAPPRPSLPRFPRFSPEEKHGRGSEHAVGVLSENGLIAVASGDRLKLSALGVDLSVDPFVFGEIHRPRLLFSADGCPYDALSGKMTLPKENDRFVWHFDSRKLLAETTLSILGSHRTYVLTLEVMGRFSRMCPLLFLEPTLTASKERLSHPAYADLTVTVSYRESEGILLYTRRQREGDKPPLCLAVSLESRSGKAEFETRRDRLGLLYGEKEIEGLLRAPMEGKTGALIHPILALRKESSASGKYRLNLLLTVGRGEEEAVSSLLAARRELRERHVKNGALYASYQLRRTAKEKLVTCVDPSDLRRMRTLMLTAVFRPRNVAPSTTFGIDSFWRHGISGDLPIFCLLIEAPLEEGSAALRWLRTVFAAHKYLSLSGIRSDLVLFYEHHGEYRNPRLQAICDAAEACACSFLLYHSGGIFPLSDHSQIELFKATSALFLTLSSDFTLDRAEGELRAVPPPVTVPVTAVTALPPVGREDVRLSLPGAALTDEGVLLYKGRPESPDRPWSYVYAGAHFGTLVTQNSLGYTWIGNCHERRITPYNADALLDFSGERLIATVCDTEYDLCACAATVLFGRGGARWQGEIQGIAYTVTAACDPKLPCKAVTVTFASDPSSLSLSYRVIPVLGERPHRNRPIETVSQEDMTLFLPRVVASEGYDVGFLTRRDFGNTTAFLLGAYPQGGARVLALVKDKYRTKEAFFACTSAYEAQTASLLPSLSLDTSDRALAEMTNYYLPYQALVCRFYGRTGADQSGGAYGFRDQLQDCLCLMLSAPKLVRTHLLRCACHQYEEGDVMHWWHRLYGVSRGVRSRYADDRLWLPYAVASYIAFTGDADVLDIKLPYLTSPPLRDEEHDRYEVAQKSQYRESLYSHCVRAIERSLRFGSRGLPLMEGGDWNDGMNRVGEAGGQSVWLGFFLAMVLQRFAPLSAAHGDASGAAKYRRIAAELLVACENCFEKDRYQRAYYGDGTPLCQNGAIDVLPQAFAVFAGADGERSRLSMMTAYRRLFEKEHGIFRLLSPPYDRPAAYDPGYISAYPLGVRENGGQYTHAAVWAAMALIACGKKEAGAEVLRTVNPAFLCQSEEGQRRYRGEPYFLAGDVSANPAFPGRCGWSLYTGAAGWYFNAVFAVLLGIVITADSFTVTPALSSAFEGYTLRFTHRDTTYDIIAKRAEVTSYRLDGENVNNLFYFDKKTHFLEITVENSSDLQ